MKGESEFGCMSGKMLDVNRGKTGEGVALLVSLEVRLCGGCKEVSCAVCESKVWVRVVGVCVCIWFPNSEKDETEREVL